MAILESALGGRGIVAFDARWDQNETFRKTNALHAAVGISGEAGELLDAIKRYFFYGKPLDEENVIEELGDLEFYLELMRKTLGITREQTLVHNLNKLLKGKDARYASGTYSDEQAIARQDKGPDTLDGRLAELEKKHQAEMNKAHADWQGRISTRPEV